MCMLTYLPSEEYREKLTPLLEDDAFAGNDVVSLKSKLPTISILNVKEFTTKDEFMEKIKEKIDTGSELSIVFSKNPRNSNHSDNTNHYYQVVARVSGDVRRAIKTSNDKIFVDFVAYRVVDRFYIKRCNKCQKFGHYEKDCQNEVCCGYCCQTLIVMSAPIVKKMVNNQ